MLLVIGGIGLTFAAVIVALVVHARRRRNKNEAHAAAERESQRWTEEARRRSEGESLAAAERQARREAEETQRRGEEEARAASEREAQRREAEEAQHRAEEEARVAAEQEAQRREVEEACRRAEEESRATVEQEAPYQAEEARRRVEKDTRDTVQPEVPLEATTARGVTPAQDGPVEARPTLAARVALIRPPETVEALGTVGSAVTDMPSQVAPPSVVLAAPPLTQRTPRQYRPTARGPAPQRAPASPSPAREARDRAMPIELRLVFEKAGFCRVSLLPRRTEGLPAEFAVEGSGSPPELQALQDEWYQDVTPPDIGRLLKEGIEWVGALSGGAAARLSLSGRAIFVLARHGELNGFVSTPRLVLGEEHIVLCVTERLPDVRAAIALTDSPEPTELSSDSGIPAGWVGLRGVRPQKSVAPSPHGDIIDALRPLPDVQIALTGGIRIDRQTWLSGFPPTVKLLGDTSALGAVTIDGQEATRSPEGGYIAAGWDSAGEHSVWCTSASRTYAIRSGAEAWEPWDAYAWSLGEPPASGTQSRPSICGVLVRPPRIARTGSRPTVVPASNPILIGARPGEIEVCTPRSDVRAGLCIGFPWFEAIWAIPADALHCDKRTARVLLIGPPEVANRADQASSTHCGRRAAQRALALASYAWCAAILAAGRKGLQTEPSRIEIADLWQSYKRSANALRRYRR